MLLCLARMSANSLSFRFFLRVTWQCLLVLDVICAGLNVLSRHSNTKNELQADDLISQHCKAVDCVSRNLLRSVCRLVALITSRLNLTSTCRAQSPTGPRQTSSLGTEVKVRLFFPLCLEIESDSKDKCTHISLYPCLQSKHKASYKWQQYQDHIPCSWMLSSNGFGDE